MKTFNSQLHATTGVCRRCLRIRRGLFALLGTFLLAVPASAQNDPPVPEQGVHVTTPSPGLATPLAPKSAEQAPACGNGACCCDKPLAQVDDAAYRLPTGSTEKNYHHALSGRGGTPPYGYAIANGRLQQGLVLGEDGLITGQPTEAGTRSVTVQMHDGVGASVLQTYTLTILRPKTASAVTPEKSKPVPLQPLTQLSLTDARAMTTLDTAVVVNVYQLLHGSLDLLKPTPAAALPDYLIDETTVEAGGSVVPPAVHAESPSPTAATPTEAASDAAPPPPPDLVDDAQAMQLKIMLQPLLGVEYPNRHMFAAALDAELCRYTRQLTLDAAKKTETKPPSDEEFRNACPVNWSKPVKATGLGSNTVRWQDLPTTLLPPALREWVIDRAFQQHPLRPWQPLQWDGRGCGCVQNDLDGTIYGFYPLWWNSGKPQPIDFSLFKRIAYFALPIGNDGSLPQPDLEAPGVSDFIETAHRHQTAIDLTLYRNDWSFLKTQTNDEREAMIEQTAQQARRIVDMPLSGWSARARAAMPGFGEIEHVANGLTLYLENLPDPAADSAEDGGKLHRFVTSLLDRLIVELRQGQRAYALNIVIQDQDLISGNGFWRLKQLIDVLYAAENPLVVDHRIDGNNAEYQSNTNVTVSFLVLLSEPTSQTKKQLRQMIENSRLLHGGDRRIFLRKIFPVVATGVPDLRQFGDDMSYFHDNFGGVAFWPVPIAGETATASHLDVVSDNFHVHLPGQSLRSERLCGWACAHRWRLRLAFELLLLVGGVAISAYALSCRVRQLGAKYHAFLMLGAVPTLALGALLLHCDPDLLSLRHSNLPLWTLLAALVMAALITLLQPRTEKP